MQILLYLVIICGCGYVGYGVGHYYKIRERFFVDIYNFSDYLIHKIDFYQISICGIIKGYLENSQSNVEFKNLLNGIIQKIDSGETIDIKLFYLKKEENQMINNFFNDLGKSDCDNQVKSIEHYKEQMKILNEGCKTESKKNGGISTKLGIFAGLGIVICLL